jgi:hypothetical protein
VDRLTGHPATIQYPPALLAASIERVFGSAPEVIEIPRGAWILQFGYKYPSALTPARPFRFIAVK